MINAYDHDTGTHQSSEGKCFELAGVAGEVSYTTETVMVSACSITASPKIVQGTLNIGRENGHLGP